MSKPAYIDSVKVDGFLNSYDISFSLNGDVNFFIGLNGTGKTTLINLLRSCLQGDGASLISSPFRQVTIKFKPASGQTRPTLTVSKRAGRTPGKPRLRYEFREKATADAEIVEQDFERPTMLLTAGTYWPHEQDAALKRQVSAIVGKLPDITWLSIHRGVFASHHYGEEPANPVDKKIAQIVVDATKYLSALDSNYAQQVELFQQYYFLSVLNAKFEDFGEASQIDLEREKAAVSHIFSELFKNSKPYDRSISEHFSRSRSSIEKLDSGTGFGQADFLMLADTIRLHKLVERWYELQRKKQEIYDPKTKFASILNALLINKHFAFNDRNQPVFQTSLKKARRKINVTDLSSGEKQLFIMLGVALLQEEKPYVFMADEPELSLHIEWQRELVSNTLKLNHRAQIIFATHSPDVVAGYQKNVLRMESLLQEGA